MDLQTQSGHPFGAAEVGCPLTFAQAKPGGREDGDDRQSATAMLHLLVFLGGPVRIGAAPKSLRGQLPAI